MPRMDTPQTTHALAKLLLIGDGKIGKTHYAGMAAAEGLNVLYLDGDVGSQTLATLDDKARRNIYCLPMVDNMEGGQREPRFADFFGQFVSAVRFRWNDTLSRPAKAKDTDEIWTISPAKLGPRDLLVIDSWTGLTESIMLKCAIACGIDLASATTNEMRPVYQSANLIATSFLQVIRSLKCHVIVIAHPDEYVHMTKPTNVRVSEAKERDMVIDWTKMIPKTTSKPQGLNMAKYFTDVAWAEIAPDKKTRRLNFQMSADRVSGGHFEGSKPADTDHSFANLVRKIGGTVSLPHAPVDSWLTITPAGEAPAEPVESKVLDGTVKAPIKGLAGFAKKKPS